MGKEENKNIPDKFDIRYNQLVEIIGKEMALFCLCAVVNVEYIPDMEYVSFSDYKEQLKGRRFRDGITKPKAEPVDGIKMKEVWRKRWGIGNEDKPYTVEDYQTLDDTFETYASRLKRAGGMDALQEDTLRVCSRMRLEADKALAKGGKDNIGIASTLNKLIQDNLSSEQLRKKDAKPIETTRVDGIVEAITKKYGVSIEMTTEEAIEVCSRWLVEHHYPITMDAAEHILLSIINCTRSNNDLPEYAELPEIYKFTDAMQYEFASSPNEEEKEAYEYLGIQRNDGLLKPYQKEI